ncbi:Morn repeat protein [Pandoravirus inopinatum]|uniref:Morn repeat protein n=1 Tax=Pandoravirus inopinatum TaxID=1605721 RepID=A0A0B5J2M0_9VIRU|nr:Morn repeat protein [Pandoravirus inopinatum]AJF97809.1 Morn repeat protein [Pandoravirus inopinatum]
MQAHADDVRACGRQNKPMWFSMLPDEIVVAILLALGDDPRSLASWGRTCKRHAAIAQDPALWRSMCAIRFPIPLHERFADFDKDHRWVYRAHRLDVRHGGSGPSARVICPQSDCIRHADIVRQWFYCGDFRDGHASGYGTGLPMDTTKPITSINCAMDLALSQGKYEGMWDNNVPHGAGVRVYPSGACYTGSWTCGQRCGHGVMIWADGSVYDGEWAEGKRHGKGTFTVPGIWRYHGEWKDDTIHGYGTYAHEDGRTYDGDWVNGKKHGRGIFTVPASLAAHGQRKDMVRHEHGICTSAIGAVHDGEWKDDRTHGRGIRIEADGTTYDGEWNVDAFNGHAVIIESDGKRYEGGWTIHSDGPNNSKSYGRGVCTYPDGSVIDGMWDGIQCLSCVGITHAPRDDPGGCASDPCMACRALDQDASSPAVTE